MATFRGFPACSCLIAWLPEYEKEALRLKYIKFHLDIYQLIGGSPKSAGTHTKGGAADTGQISTDLIRLARNMGADAGWHRPKNWDRKGGMAHAHLVLRGCPHNGPARYQIESRSYGVDYGKNGLANGGKDDGPKPLSKRTWKEGIEWAKRQQAAAAVGTPTPAPIPEPLLSDDTTLTLVYWNCGPLPYSNLNAAAKSQIQKIIQTLKDARPSLAVLMELHEENGNKGALGYFKSIMPDTWEVIEGDGGNHLVSMGGKYSFIRKENRVSRNRAFSLWNLRRKDTGLAFWVSGLHVTAGNTPANVYDRSIQVRDLVNEVYHIARGIVCVDKNNYTASPGSPTKRLKDAGIVSIFDGPVPVVGKGKNTRHDKPRKVSANPNNIDFLGAQAFVEIVYAEQINTDHVGGDHDALKGTFKIKGTK